jgi:hypothetical protein
MACIRRRAGFCCPLAVLSVGWRWDRQLPERRPAEPQISAIVSSVQGPRLPHARVTPKRDRDEAPYHEPGHTILRASVIGTALALRCWWQVPARRSTGAPGKEGLTLVTPARNGSVNP